MKEDTILQSAGKGRILGSIIMAIVASFLGVKGIALTPEDKENGELIVAALFSAVSSAVVLWSKLREKK